jgi:hypothetical protein
MNEGNSTQPDGAESLPGFRCRICRQWHERLPMSYSAKVAQAVAAIPEWQLDILVAFTLDQCVIDKQEFYIRGRIVVPVFKQEEPFIWGVWAKVDEGDFLRANELWETEGRENEPPFRGWLNTPIALYQGTMDLELRVRTQPVGQRPHFEIVDSGHPLAVEQRRGITMDRVREIAESFLHPDARAI